MRAQLCIQGLQVCYCGGSAVEMELKKMLLEDNSRNAKLLERLPGKKLPTNFSIEPLEDIKARTLMVMQTK